MAWNQFEGPQNDGGYMDTSSTMDTTVSGEDKGNVKRGQNCVPVMIGHLNLYGDKLKVWGTQAKIVTFLGIVTKHEQVSTKVTYEFLDDTGTIKGIRWLEEKSTFDSPVQVNSYAKVYGMCREQNDSMYVMIVNIQPLEDLNEILTHHMEVTLVALQGEKRLSLMDTQPCNGSNLSMQNPTNNTSSNTHGLNQTQQSILSIIETGDPEFGAERNDIKARAQHIAHQVDDILEFLLAEGHIYTTKTDDYFKAI